MNGRLKILILVLVVISGVRLALAAWNWLEEAPITPKAAMARSQPRERAYIDVSPKARALLIENVKKVKIGDSKDEVYEKLGDPQDELPPETRPAGKTQDNIVVASQIIAYHIRQKKADQFDENFDEHIYIFLDQDDLVEYIYVLRQDQPKPVKYPKLPHYVQTKEKK
jgi:hypothetical protein